VTPALWLALTTALAGQGHGPPSDTTVVRGTVVEHTAHARPDGLYTTYLVRVEERLRGDSPPEVRVTLPGGRAGGLRMTVRGVPLFELGDDAIVSMRADPPPPLHGHFRVVGETLQPALDGWPTAVARLEEQLQTSMGPNPPAREPPDRP